MSKEHNKWILRHGCHRGTVFSRDIADDEKWETREQAIHSYMDHRAAYHNIGYQIWYARIVSPSGVEELLEQNSYYY